MGYRGSRCILYFLSLALLISVSRPCFSELSSQIQDPDGEILTIFHAHVDHIQIFDRYGRLKYEHMLFSRFPSYAKKQNLSRQCMNLLLGPAVGSFSGLALGEVYGFATSDFQRPMVFAAALGAVSGAVVSVGVNLESMLAQRARLQSLEKVWEAWSHPGFIVYVDRPVAQIVQHLRELEDLSKNYLNK